MKKIKLSSSLLGFLLLINNTIAGAQTTPPPSYNLVKSIGFTYAGVGTLNDYMNVAAHRRDGDLLPVDVIRNDLDFNRLGVRVPPSLTELRFHLENFPVNRPGVILYDPEPWDYTPPIEYYLNGRNVMASTIATGSTEVHNASKLYGLIPALPFTYDGNDKCNGIIDTFLKAPGHKGDPADQIEYSQVDYFVLPMQNFISEGCDNLENRMTVATNFVKAWSEYLKRTNPDIKFFVQFSFQQNSKTSIIDFMERINKFVDGFYLGLSCTNGVRTESAPNVTDGGCLHTNPSYRSYTAADVIEIVEKIRNDNETVIRSCIGNSNVECMKSIVCPLNRQLTRIKVACDLSQSFFSRDPSGAIPDNETNSWSFNPLELIANRIDVLYVKPTDTLSTCTVGSKSINYGTTTLSGMLTKRESFNIGCQNRNTSASTGNCKITVELRCGL